MKFLSFLCTKWMENCEAMTSSPHSFAYSYRLVKKCFLKICETSKCHNFLIFQPIFIRFSLLCLNIFTLSSEIELNLLWSSSLMIKFEPIFATIQFTFHSQELWLTHDMCILSRWHLFQCQPINTSIFVLTSFCVCGTGKLIMNRSKWVGIHLANAVGKGLYYFVHSKWTFVWFIWNT